jgi:hypothetical protein
MNVRLLIYPDYDLQFGREVQALLDQGVATPTELQTQLRPLHPEVRVTNGVTEADGRKRWYVFRDGRYMGTPPSSLDARTRSTP